MNLVSFVERAVLVSDNPIKDHPDHLEVTLSLLLRDKLKIGSVAELN